MAYRRRTRKRMPYRKTSRFARAKGRIARRYRRTKKTLRRRPVYRRRYKRPGRGRRHSSKYGGKKNIGDLNARKKFFLLWFFSAKVGGLPLM